MELYLFSVIFTSILFFISFITKFFNIKKFIEVFISLGFKKKYSSILAKFILFCELLVSIFVLFKSTNLLGGIILLFLILCFLLATIYSQIKNLKIICNCFGQFTDDHLGKSTYFRIGILITLFLILIFSPYRVGIIDMPLDVTLNLFLSGVNLMLIYFLLIAFYKYIFIRKDKSI